MFEKMAMVDERTHDARIPEIHSQFDAWISAAFTVPILDVDGVAQEWLICRCSVRLYEQEMKLMDVKGVELLCPIFDDPVFHISIAYDHVRKFGSRIEGGRRLPLDRQHKNGPAITIIRI